MIRAPRKLTPEVCEKIKTLYIQNELTQPEVASILGLSTPTVAIYLKSKGLSRSTSDANLLAIKRERWKTHNKKDFIQSQITELYLNQKLTCKEIGIKLNTCAQTVRKYVKLQGVMRSRSDELKLCHTKYPQMHRSRFGKDSPAWKGGRSTNSKGYVEILEPSHPRARKDGYVLEHIAIWEKVHNKPLPKGWEVHHLNGIHDDNKPKNLKGLPSKKHKLVIPAMQERIRELEAEVKLLEHALDANQLMFNVSEN